MDTTIYRYSERMDSNELRADAEAAGRARESADGPLLGPLGSLPPACLAVPRSSILLRRLAGLRSKSRLVTATWSVESRSNSRLTSRRARQSVANSVQFGMIGQSDRAMSGSRLAGAVRRPRSLPALKFPIGEPIVAFAVHPCPLGLVGREHYREGCDS